LDRLITQHSAAAEKCQQLIATLEEGVTAATTNQIAKGIHERLAEREAGDNREILQFTSTR